MRVPAIAVLAYLQQLPGAIKDGRCFYTPHSLRATTATLLLDAGVDITKMQEFLGYRHITTTSAGAPPPRAPRTTCRSEG